MHRYIWLVVAVLAVAAASPAGATFPDKNGGALEPVLEKLAGLEPAPRR